MSMLPLQTTVFRIMFNHWKEFLTFHASIEESKVSQHLEELQKKHKAEVRAKRMIADRRRLAKVAFDKRKKEREERERNRERPRHDAARFAFLIVEVILSSHQTHQSGLCDIRL